MIGALLEIGVALTLLPFVGPQIVKGYRWVATAITTGGANVPTDTIDLVVDGPPAPPPSATQAPLPAAWSRWNGARPELRGSPADTILDLHGLETTTPEFRAAFLDVAERLGIPVDSLAVVLSHEAGFNPKAFNPLPAAGIFQLTTQANLPGYTTKADIIALLDKSATEQLVPLEAFYKRAGDKLRGDTPGQILLENFLPVYLGKPEDFVVATVPPELGSGWAKIAYTADGKAQLAAVQAQRGLTAQEKYYVWNPGMDLRGVGAITVGDVYQGAANIAAGAKGKRMAIDGSIWSPP